MSPSTWRLVREGPYDGAANMARDEVLLDTAEGGAPPALRLYAWSCPTLSLGAHQPSADADLEACRRGGVGLVRRPTGGGAVLHDMELTYSVTGRIGEDPFPSSVVALYDRIAAALIAGLERIGVEAKPSRGVYRGRAPADCFGAPSARELVVGGRKLVGSAQVRRRGAFLQHGSILIDWNAALLAQVLRPAGGRASAPGAERIGHRGAAPAEGGTIRSPSRGAGGQAVPSVAGRLSASGMPSRHEAATLRDLLGREVPREEVEEAIAEGFRAAFGALLAPSALSREEAERAVRLRTFKYLDALWTLEGRVRAVSAGRAPGLD